MAGCSDSGCNYACRFMLLGDVWIFFFSQVGDPQVKSNIKGLKVV